MVDGVYEELKGISASIPTDRTWFDDKGFAEQASSVVRRVGLLCPEIENISSYRIEPQHSQGRGNIVDVITAKTKLNGLIGRVKGTYSFNDTSSSNGGNTFIQNQSQSQEQHQTLILDFQERILSEIPKHNVDTKERKFLEKLKIALPTFANTTSLISSVLNIALDTGLTIEEVKRLLGL